MIEAWYMDALQEASDNIIDLCVHHYYDVCHGKQNKIYDPHGIPITEDVVIGYLLGKYLPILPAYFDRRILNTERIENGYKCMLSKYAANVWFIIQPSTYLNIEKIIGKEVTPVLKGWSASSNIWKYAGSPRTDPVDPVDHFAHPLTEQYVSIYRLFPGHRPTRMEFAVGLSVRGINRRLKELGLSE